MLVGGVLGATLAFLISRFLGRDWTAQSLRGQNNLMAIDQTIGHAGWKLVALIRLSPMFPFNLVNYIFGLTRISLIHYLIGTAVGLIPGSFLYVYHGALLGSQETVLPTAAAIALRISSVLALIASLVLLIYTIRIVHSALKSASIETLADISQD